jgi:hypothetical protein
MRLFDQPWPEGDYRFFQLGFVVNDLLSAAAAWARVVGVGPFHVLPPIEQPCTYRGTASAINIQVAVAQAGPVQIELIKQHCHRPSVFRDWSTGNVSGLHQLCTVTADYEGKKAHYERLGYEVASEIDMGDYRVAYINTADDFGFYTEILAQNAQLLGLLANIADTCAHWDGTDPVRLLTRDGYRVP